MSSICIMAAQSQRVGQVYGKYYPRLKRYFLRQLGDPSEADDCVRETVYRFFDFMRRRRWEEEAEYVPVYLMRTACIVCSENLSRKAQRAGYGY